MINHPFISDLKARTTVVPADIAFGVLVVFLSDAQLSGDRFHYQYGLCAWLFCHNYSVRGVFRSHEPRHTFASIAITSGADVASVSEALGHSDKTVTLRMYTHANKESISDASKIFREAIKKPVQNLSGTFLLSVWVSVKMVCPSI